MRAMNAREHTTSDAERSRSGRAAYRSTAGRPGVGDAGTAGACFLGSPPKPSARLLRRLTSMDYHDRFALVAADESGRGVGIARYGLLEPGISDVAVVVTPEWRRAGLATMLVKSR